jgi:hypothetical protein
MSWAIIIIGTVVIALVFFEWRSRNKPMPSALLQYRTHPRAKSPFDGSPEIEKPRD